MGTYQKLAGAWPKLRAAAGTTLTVGAANVAAVVAGNENLGKEDVFDAGRPVRRVALLAKLQDWRAAGGQLESKIVWHDRRWRVAAEVTVPGVSPYVQLEVISE
ncbi:MAG: hypothetical protein LBD30_00350 [Verrucomicrobiales bacterium]|jgi:hypothetical protein|nr:hypothetical protein [Verrucomicrobiales bacterium]